MTHAQPPADETLPTPDNERQIGLLILSIMACVVGLLTGFGAAALRGLLAFFHNLFFAGEFSLAYDANVFDPANPFGPLIVLAPVIGGLGVVFLVKNFAPEARGHGVPEVMDAVYYKKGRIRPAVVFVKSVASALSIGSGASVGREGPIIQIGSGIGSWLGQLGRLAPWQTITLVAAGAGAGIAATFNTPLGAVMFAIELILPEVSTRTFLPVVLATGAATSVGWLFFGVSPAFVVPLTGVFDTNLPFTLSILPMYIVFGALCGLACTGFIKLLERMEDLFPSLHPNPYVQNMIGMTVIGVMLYVFHLATGHYHVGGVGYATIQSIFTGESYSLMMLVVLFSAKLVATTVSVGSGASGGIFSPSLFLGVTLGGIFGSVLSLLFPGLGANPVEFGIIGMAGVVGGATGAAMTAILMIFEMTQDYHAIVPAIITVACSIAIRRTLSEENIYTLKLVRRGHHIPKSRHSHIFFIRQARDHQLPIVGMVDLQTLEANGYPFEEQKFGYLLVSKDDHIFGILPLAPDEREGAHVVRDFAIVRGQDFLRDVVRRMLKRGRRYALVTENTGVPRPNDVTGVITRSHLGEVFLELLSD